MVCRGVVFISLMLARLQDEKRVLERRTHGIKNMQDRTEVEGFPLELVERWEVLFASLSWCLFALLVHARDIHPFDAARLRYMHERDTHLFDAGRLRDMHERGTHLVDAARLHDMHATCIPLMLVCTTRTRHTSL